MLIYLILFMLAIQGQTFGQGIVYQAMAHTQEKPLARARSQKLKTHKVFTGMRVDMQKGRRMAKLIILNLERAYCFEDLYSLVQYQFVALALIEAF